MWEVNNYTKVNNILLKIKSKYILKSIFDILIEKKFLQIIIYNKKLQKKLDKKINDYKYEFLKIEIEIIPKEYIDSGTDSKMINFIENKDSLFHIYFDENQNEIKRNYITKDENEKVSKIKVIIEPKIKTLHELFKDCKYIKKVNFLKFNRKDIKDMSNMFHKCQYLEEINF